MKNREKGHIDELFREGLNPEKDPVAFREEDWEKLEKRLDRHEKKKGLIFWLKPLIGVAALLLLFFSIWTIWPEKQAPPIQQVEVQTQEPQTPDEKKQPLTSSEEIKEKGDNGSITSPSKVLTEAGSKQTSKEGEGLTEKAPVEPGTVRDMDEKISENTPDETAIPEDKTVVQPDTEESMDQSPLAADETKTPQPISPEEKIDPLPYERPVEEPDYDEITAPKHRQLAVSLLVAPAYNGIDNLNNGQVGGDVGLLLTLGLSKRWSFSTGAVYAKKLYEAGLDDYGASSYASENQMVNADCRVLDIPLNVNYTLIDKGKTTFSLGTGISSYIMLREDYRFDVESYNGPEDIHLTNENQHWLSVLNLHANYQRQLSPRIGISLQPFMKIPLEDIGYAKVRLQSLGMAISASWNFSL
jgi:hypothetical protein